MLTVSDEIRQLMAATGREWLDIVVPEQEDGGDADDDGNYHAFEWALRKKPDGDCMFLEGGRCTVYESRPGVCRNYPDSSRCGYYDFLRFERAHQADPEFIATT